MASVTLTGRIDGERRETIAVMGARYKNISRHQLDLFNRNHAHMFEVLELYEDLAEFILEGLEALPRESRGVGDDEILGQVVLISRHFNDLEAAKTLALRGLPDQAYGLIRDTIECTLLMKLLLKEGHRATKWLDDLKEYSAGSVKAELARLGVPSEEYSQYGWFSWRTHPNYVACLANISADDQGYGIGFGSHDNPSATTRALAAVVLQQLQAVVDPSRAVFRTYAPEPSVRAWEPRISNFVRRVESLVDQLGPGLDPTDKNIAARKAGRKIDQMKHELDRTIELRKRLFYGASDQ
jgi:hypothetical protein